MAIYQSAKNILERVKDEEVLEKIKKVDGNGSGLDADLLRGLPADFTCSKNSNGYTKLPNGLIIQWGKYIFSISGTGWKGDSVTFPLTFPNQIFNIVMTLDATLQANPDFRSLTLAGNSPSNSGFTFSFCVINIAVNGNVALHWQAIGY